MERNFPYETRICRLAGVTATGNITITGSVSAITLGRWPGMIVRIR
jgi:hypothetical protein